MAVAHPTAYGNITISTTATTYPVGSITVPSGGYLVSNGTSASNWSTTNITQSNQPTLTVTGNAEIEGKLKVGGKDIAKSLEEIEKRLAILVPNPEKLEHFESLKKAYEHYKVLEALCEIPKEKKE